jgi:sec-independent protein translocase protein TatA
MLGIGIWELLLVLVIVLIVFGPSKLPELGKSIGKGLKEFKKASSEITEELKKPDTKEGDKPNEAASADKSDKKDTPKS